MREMLRIIQNLAANEPCLYADGGQRQCGLCHGYAYFYDGSVEHEADCDYLAAVALVMTAEFDELRRASGNS